MIFSQPQNSNFLLITQLKYVLYLPANSYWIRDKGHDFTGFLQSLLRSPIVTQDLL